MSPHPRSLTYFRCLRIALRCVPRDDSLPREVATAGEVLITCSSSFMWKAAFLRIAGTALHG